MRVALVHDYLNQYGGAERVLETFHQLFPDAPVFTSIYDRAAMPPQFRSWDIRTSFLQHIPAAHRYHRALLLLYPAAFESFDLNDYDVVISNSSAWAKGIVTSPDTFHLCYCLTPMRFAWSYGEYVERERLPSPIRAVLPAAMHYLRTWDTLTANRVDQFIGISRAVVARINKYYRREADLLAPPVDVEHIPIGNACNDDYLVVSRLIPYKRIDLAVRACTQLGAALTVAGDGRDRERLERLAGPTIRFTGPITEADKHHRLSGCRAFIFPGEEDFGIAPVEAMAAGRPVVAYAAGGALDTVHDGVTGRLFSPQSVDALATALSSFDPASYDRHVMRAHAETFATPAFQQQFVAYVEQASRSKAAAVAQSGRAPV